MATGDKQLTISFELDRNRVGALRRAFPEREDLQEIANTVACLMTNEFVDLLAGHKRYLSLSHQYIEWMQQLYEALLPEEEYKYERFYDNFNFPPGTAAYMARVLRSRQNSVLHSRATEQLKRKLGKERDIYEALKDPQPAQNMRSIRLKSREFDILNMAVDKLLDKELAVEQPDVTSRSKEHVVVSLHIENVRAILGELGSLE